MAIEKPTTVFPWDNPTWPERLPNTAEMRVLYGATADELVVRFSATPHQGMVIVVPVTTPDRDYASLLVADDSGDVIGVHVMPLVAYATRKHPDWIRLAYPEPEPAAVERVVADIRSLFARYGVDDPQPE
jgi:hypothetical protein